MGEPQNQRESELEKVEKSPRLRSYEKVAMCSMLDVAQNKQVKFKPQKDSPSPCLKFLQTED